MVALIDHGKDLCARYAHGVEVLEGDFLQNEILDYAVEVHGHEVVVRAVAEPVKDQVCRWRVHEHGDAHGRQLDHEGEEGDCGDGNRGNGVLAMVLG